MTHEELCLRARVWLRGTRRCNPVYSRNASCAEIPDAIGWSSAYQHRGSVVVECKTSIEDFYADKKKRVRYRHIEFGLKVKKVWQEQKEKFERVELPRMGDYRFYMCEPGVLSAELVEKHAPDHGLVHVRGTRVKVIREAPKRTEVDKDSEIRYLRFSIINRKCWCASNERAQTETNTETETSEEFQLS